MSIDKNEIKGYNTVCDQNKCNACYACEEICPSGAIKIVDNIKNYSALIDQDKCINCNLCVKVCPNFTKPTFYPIQTWYQGWADNSIRSKSSSGGIAYKISEEFIKTGGYVCACVFEKGEFIFRIISKLKDLYRIQGSKYVKSNPCAAYKEVLCLIKKGEKVLFIGLPCQVAAMKNYIGNRNSKKLYTVDLICHGSPSPKVLEYYLNEKNISLDKVQSIKFRGKDNYGLHVDDKKLDVITDKYTTAFMEGICYTENCYSCIFAQRNRVADITLGDSWGTDLESELKNGISLILCMNDRGEDLISAFRDDLKDVDLKKAISSNRQLNAPSEKHKNCELFFRKLKNGEKFSMIVFRCCIFVSIRQTSKKLLLNLRILKSKK